MDSETETQTGLKRKFRSEWLQQFTWLRNNNGLGFCIACERPICNNVSFLKQHATFRMHVQNVEKKKHQLKIDSCMNQENTKFMKQVHHAELTLVMFLICHNLPFVLMDYLPELLVECCCDSKIAKSIKCGRTKATELADLLGNTAAKTILAQLKTTKFSLIVDESTDVYSKKSLVLVARYMDKLARKVKDRSLGLIELSDCNASSIYASIKFFFDKHEIPMANLIGLATDGASVMAGEINGLQAIFKRTTDLFYMKCSCHSLHLCSSYACKKLPLEIEKLCRNIYTFFSHSPKRISEFKEFQEYCSVKPHKILGVSLT
ncbi:uncharacterized protein LOC118756478, partial [Rhagoletis pomonella]|uniref:uncharacterized protein LOC118756478 n=1 Tax=Rhagoletis pomonella TaxID=28610 RepID=UPI00177CEB79